MKFFQRLWVSFVGLIFRFFAWTRRQVLEAEAQSRSNRAMDEWAEREKVRAKPIEVHLAQGEHPIVKSARSEGNANALPMNAKLNAQEEVGAIYLGTLPTDKQATPPPEEAVQPPKDAA